MKSDQLQDQFVHVKLMIAMAVFAKSQAENNKFSDCIDSCDVARTLCNRNSTTAIWPWAAAHINGVNPSSSCRFITDSENKTEKLLVIYPFITISGMT